MSLLSSLYDYCCKLTTLTEVTKELSLTDKEIVNVITGGELLDKLTKTLNFFSTSVDNKKSSIFSSIEEIIEMRLTYNEKFQEIIDQFKEVYHKLTIERNLPKIDNNDMTVLIEKTLFFIQIIIDIFESKKIDRSSSQTAQKTIRIDIGNYPPASSYAEAVNMQYIFEIFC